MVDDSENKVTFAVGKKGQTVKELFTKLLDQKSSFVADLSDKLLLEENESTTLSTMSSAVAGWLLAHPQYQNIGDTCYEDVEKWFKSKIGFGPELTCHFHSAPSEAINVVLREIYRENGCSTNSVVYISPSLMNDNLAYVDMCKEWPVIIEKDIPQQLDGSIDLKGLATLVNKHQSESRKSLLLIANVGSGVTGCYDNISTLANFCKKNNIWLHLDGPRLVRRITRSLEQPSNKTQIQLPEVKSMSLNLGTWLGYTGSPVMVSH